jgi:flagellar assembly factor FliW
LTAEGQPDTAGSTLAPLGDRRAIVFDEGLVGCPDWRRFELEPDVAGPAIHLLRCRDVEGVALYAADPFTIVPDYEFEIADPDADALELSDPRDALVLVVLTIHEEPPQVTANLMGPLVVNVVTGRGRQLVLGASEYSVRHPVG